MNAIEQRIATTFAPGILTEIREELNGLKGKISQKNWDRMNGKLRARSRFLSRGSVEETIAEPTGLAPAKVPSLLKKKRKVNWIPIKRTDADGCIWLDGWRRPKGSRKARFWKKLKTPQLIFDPKKVVEKTKKKSGKKKAKS